MLERYIQQIVTMELFVDAVTIIDEKGTIRYFKSFRDGHVPLHFTDIVGKNFLEVFTDVDPQNSTVLKALQGEPTYYNKITTDVSTGISNEVVESVYPIEINGKIIGAVCTTRGIGSAYEPLRKITLQPIENHVSSDDALNNLVGDSAQMSTLRAKIEHIASASANVLIYGETGTGKELVAKALHDCSPRKNKLFFSQNCAAIPSNLAESIFFGSEKGIYTGSVSRPGILEMTAGGTVFLDEVNSLDLSVQAKLLKSLEENQIRRLGGSAPVNVDFRIIAAANEEPFQCVKLGKIRRDLFYRLSTILIEVPPLRERGRDVVQLAEHFIKMHNKKADLEILGLSKSAEEIFQTYSWPGNVRELKNAVEYALIFTRSTVIDADSLPSYILEAVKAPKSAAPDGLSGSSADCTHPFSRQSLPNGKSDAKQPAALQKDAQPLYVQSHALSLPEDATLQEAVSSFEEAFLKDRLKKNSNHSLLAKELGITRQTLINKIRKYRL